MDTIYFSLLSKKEGRYGKFTLNYILNGFQGTVQWKNLLVEALSLQISPEDVIFQQLYPLFAWRIEAENKSHTLDVKDNLHIVDH